MTQIPKMNIRGKIKCHRNLTDYKYFIVRRTPNELRQTEFNNLS